MTKDGKQIEFRWLGTAGFHVKYGELELLLDPYLSRPVGAKPLIRVSKETFSQVSWILVSHGHFDHAMDVAELARLSGARVCAPRETCRIYEKQGIEPSRLFANEDQPDVSYDGLKVRIVPSKHITFDTRLVVTTLARVFRAGIFFEMLPLLRGYPLGSNSDILLDFSGYRVLFSGSGGGNWTRLSRLEPHCFLLPFAGRSDIADHYVRALRILHPDTVVIHHHDEFYPHFCVSCPIDAFTSRLARELPDIRLIVPEPLEELRLP